MGVVRDRGGAPARHPRHRQPRSAQLVKLPANRRHLNLPRATLSIQNREGASLPRAALAENANALRLNE